MFNENSLLMNGNKTKCVFFRYSHNKTVYPKYIDLNGDLIEFFSTSTFMGVSIDVQMNWMDHLQQLGGKLSRNCKGI